MPSNMSECARMSKRGTKRKIEIEKRETKQQRSVACSKRRQTLFSKAADLCLFSGANIAVFVTSPAENSDVVYSFSGYSSASEIADCYLNGKPPLKVNPQTKVGFWWEEPTDLYHSCNDLSELNIIEDRIQRTKKHIMACLEKKENSQFVSSFHQNPSTAEISNDVSSCSQIACTGSLDGFHGCQNPNYLEIASIDHSSLEKNYGEPSSEVITCFDQNPSFSVEEIYGEYSCDQSRYLVNDDLGFVNCLWETEKDNNGMSVTQETTFNEDQSFLENLFNDDDNVFGLKNGNNNLQVTLLPDHSSTNEENELMIDVGELFSDEEIELLQF